LPAEDLDENETNRFFAPFAYLAVEKDLTAKGAKSYAKGAMSNFVPFAVLQSGRVKNTRNMNVRKTFTEPQP